MIHRTVRSWFNLALVVLLQINLLSSCDQRFSASPLHDANYRTELPLESIVLTEAEVSEFDADDLIQYLKLHEQNNWIDTSEREMIGWLEKFENQIEVLELISDFYLSRDRIERALFYNTQAEEHGANSTEFYKKRAKIHMALGQYELAIDYINKAVTINGNDPDTYLSKGDVYMRLGDSASALQYKEQAFVRDSSRLDIAADLAHLYASTGENPKAMIISNMLIGKNYQLKEMTYLNVELFRLAGQDLEANKLLKTLLNSNEVRAGMDLIDYFQQQNRYDSIVHYATKVLEFDSLNLLAMEAKAMTFDKKGYFTSALIYYHQMLGIDSLNKEALEGIRKVNGKIAYLRKLREQREAIPTFDFASPKKETN